MVWKEIIDTADPDPLKHHCRRLRGALQLRSFDSPGLALELPIEWLDASGEFEALRAESPWQRLFQSFGACLGAVGGRSLVRRGSYSWSGSALSRAEWSSWPASGNLVLRWPLGWVFRLAIECLRPCTSAWQVGHRAAVGFWAGRCLYFPKDGTSCFPCSCTLRDYDALKAWRMAPEPPGLQAQLCRKERVQDDEPTFILRRMGAAVRPRPPEAPGRPHKAGGWQVILVTTSRPSLVCGREGADVSLRAAHVSKTHAVLRLSRYGNSYRLTVEDKSSNGTWVNGVRLKAEPMVLKARDQICFVPPAHDVEQLLYEVGVNRLWCQVWWCRSCCRTCKEQRFCQRNQRSWSPRLRPWDPTGWLLFKTCRGRRVAGAGTTSRS